MTVQVWDAATGDNFFTYADHPVFIHTLAWSPDSIHIASAIGDEVHVWETTTGIFFTYRGHTNTVVTLAWSPDGKRIASSSKDGKVQVWDVSTGSTIRTYHGHVDRVNALDGLQMVHILSPVDIIAQCRSGMPPREVISSVYALTFILEGYLSWVGRLMASAFELVTMMVL